MGGVKISGYSKDDSASLGRAAVEDVAGPAASAPIFDLDVS